MTFLVIVTILVLCLLLLCIFFAMAVVLLCVQKWPKLVAMAAALLATWWVFGPIAPESSRPSSGLTYNNRVWLLPEAQRRLDELAVVVNDVGIAYSENSYVRECQQKTGVQLLGFRKVSKVWTYSEKGWCSEKAFDVPTLYRVDRSKLSAVCHARISTTFVNPMESMECIERDTVDKSGGKSWQILLNCSQSTQEYQLRWFQPNMLAGGSYLESFAGTNFDSGHCLDPSHEKTIGALLDVIGLGPGQELYRKAPQ